MIAIECAELLGRPSCSTCNDALRWERGCKRPGMEVDNDSVCWRFSSPKLGGLVLYECPVSYLLRESPSVYELLHRLRLSESMSPLEFSLMPRYFQAMSAIHSSVVSWVQEQHKLSREIQRQADYARRATSG